MTPSVVLWSGAKSEWQFERRRKPLDAIGILDSTFFIGVSLRNPAFSTEWMECALVDIQHLRGRTIVCLVDAPYINTIKAQSFSDWDQARQFKAIKQQRDEQVGRLQRIVSRAGGACELIDWSDLNNDTPDPLKLEVKTAYYQSAEVRELVQRQVRKVFPDVREQDRLDMLAAFFLDEVPVLAMAYYKFFDGCIDVYPGPQADFLWALDEGTLKAQLPKCSRLAAKGRPHTYACMRLRSRPATRLKVPGHAIE